MNVLVVNGFSNTSKGQKKFDEFFSLIKKIFKKLSQKTGIDDIEYNVRTYADIDEFLSDLDSNSNVGMNNDNLIIPNGITIQPLNLNNKRFEKLDFIFIDGSEAYLPWKCKNQIHSNNKFAVLLKMCKLTNKVLFAGSFGMQTLMYFFATNFNTEIDVINVSKEVQTLENIDKIPQNFLKNIKKNQFFLDYVSGDLYDYKKVYNKYY
jgi:hypothetical protein